MTGYKVVTKNYKSTIPINEIGYLQEKYIINYNTSYVSVDENTLGIFFYSDLKSLENQWSIDIDNHKIIEIETLTHITRPTKRGNIYDIEKFYNNIVYHNNIYAVLIFQSENIYCCHNIKILRELTKDEIQEVIK